MDNHPRRSPHPSGVNPQIGPINFSGESEQFIIEPTLVRLRSKETIEFLPRSIDHRTRLGVLMCYTVIRELEILYIKS